MFIAVRDIAAYAPLSDEQFEVLGLGLEQLLADRFRTRKGLHRDIPMPLCLLDICQRDNHRDQLLRCDAIAMVGEWSQERCGAGEARNRARGVAKVRAEGLPLNAPDLVVRRSDLAREPGVGSRFLAEVFEVGQRSLDDRLSCSG